MPAGAVFHFNDPQVAIEVRFARKVGVDGLVGTVLGQRAFYPLAIKRAHIKAGRRWPIELRMAIQPVDANENGAGIVVAVAHHEGGHAHHGAAPDVCFDPQFGF